MYVVEDQELDIKRAKLLHVSPTTIAERGFDFMSIRLQVSVSILSATHQLLRFHEKKGQSISFGQLWDK